MDFFILVTGTDAGEREDYMTEKIREYSMNGALIIGVDNGYGNMKTARRCFKTAIAKYDSAPVLSRDYIEYDGGYYVIGEGRKGFVADEYYGAAEPPVRCGESHLSGLTEPLRSL